MKPGDQINVRVKSQTKGETHFKVRTTTKFEKIFKAYCARESIAVDSVRFIYDGDRIQGHQTPGDVDMEHNAQIDAMIAQEGGRLVLKQQCPLLGSTSARCRGSLIICRRLKICPVLYGLELPCATIP